MALPHTLSGQVVSVLALGDRLAQTTSSAILKAGQLEVMRVVLRAGDLVHLQPRALHALTAVEDASLLVTICLAPG